MAAIRHYKPDTHKPKQKPCTDPERAALIDTIHFTNGMLSQCTQHTKREQRGYFLMLRGMLEDNVNREKEQVTKYIRGKTNDLLHD